MRRGEYWLTRLCFQRALAFIYCIAFWIICRQFLPLLGSQGITPIAVFVPQVDPWRLPSLFFLNHSDSFLGLMGWVGLALSFVALSGLSERFNVWISAAVWFLLWAIYLSFVNVGQTFYGFGWEMILLESGFLAIFLGSRNTPPPKIVIWLIRWILFRVMFGAGLIKIRADECWRDLTCMAYHYETQPIPNPLSWYFHWLPLWFHKLEVAFTHFVELAVPFGLFLIRWIVIVSGALTFLFQFILILSGNLSWLNYMTLVLTFACFDDAFLGRLIRVKVPELAPMTLPRKCVIGVLTVAIVLLSIPPTMNLLSRRQIMNTSFNSLHLVNTYGAFGNVTKVRRELVIEGTAASKLGPSTEWKEYEFKCKPGDLSRRPCVVSPYHLRLDWQIWFAPMSTFKDHPWILSFVAKLLEGNRGVLSLLAKNPFPEAPPKFIRAVLYEYRFTTADERRESGAWWVRKRVGLYLTPLSLDNSKFKDILRQLKWLN